MRAFSGTKLPTAEEIRAVVAKQSPGHGLWLRRVDECDAVGGVKSKGAGILDRKDAIMQQGRGQDRGHRLVERAARPPTRR